MISDKLVVQYLLAVCKTYQISDWVLSPGSRNAAITSSVANNDFFNCESVLDERAAAFYALGKSIKTRKPTVICCTSGSAALNYAPAISEAYYQNIPLLIITADRPAKWIDNGEGQSINQVRVYENYCNQNFTIQDDSSTTEIQEIFTEIANLLSKEYAGPIHLNIGFNEPLYNFVSNSSVEKEFYDNREVAERTSKVTESVEELDLKSFNRVLLLIGQLPINHPFKEKIKMISNDSDVLVMTESLANVEANHNMVYCIDRTLTNVDLQDEQYHPDLVITFPGAIVSKRIKAFLRSVNYMKHLEIAFGNKLGVDVFEKGVKSVNSSFLNNLIDFKSGDAEFKVSWLQKAHLSEIKHEHYIEKLPWSDLKLMYWITEFLPEFSELHLGNSATVRYQLLFKPIRTISYLGNRGVSGIDGCTSTARGYASKSDKLNVLVTGDLSFLYDSNGLMNPNFPANLKVVIVNNNGGGIFRIIPGPEKTNVQDSFFDTPHSVNIQSLCQAHGLTHKRIESEDELVHELETFFLLDNPVQIIEVVTPRFENDKILKRYFEQLKV